MSAQINQHLVVTREIWKRKLSGYENRDLKFNDFQTGSIYKVAKRVIQLSVLVLKI